MRVDQAAALAALQARLLGLARGQDQARLPGFKADVPLPAPQAPPTAANGAAVPAASLAMLVAAASAPLAQAAALKRAERGLAALERLHRLIRSGAAPADELDELAGWQAEGGAGEGAAGALLEEVELRILVELAKRGR